MNTVGKSTGPSGPSAQPPATGGETTATVKQGESSVSDVAKRVGVSQQSLKEANPQIKDPNKLTAGQELKVPEKKEPEKPATDSGAPTKTSGKDSRARMAERSMEGVIMEASLRSKTDTGTIRRIPTPPDADTLIKKHTGMLGNLDKGALGKEMAGLATKEDFAFSKKSVDGVMDNLSDSNKDDVALAFTKNLSDDQLKKLASSTDGQSTLHRMEKELLDGSVFWDERGQANRIHDALKGAKLDPATQSDVLINRHTRGLDLDEAGLGMELADMAKKDPTAASETFDKTLEKLHSSDRDDVAYEMTKNMTHQDLKKLGGSPEGKALLNRMGSEMKSGWDSKEERTQAARLDTAKTAVDLEGNYFFKGLSEPTRKDVLSAMERTETDSGVSKNIATLSTTPGFEKLSEATRKEMIDAMEKKGGSPKAADSIKRLAGNVEFQKLGDAGRINVVKDLSKFTETESYNKMSETDKAKSLNIISDLALHSAENPTFTTARNTLNHLVNGKVKMELYEEKDSNTMGTASNGTMRFNIAHPKLLTGRDELVKLAAHEVNHVLNGDTRHGTPERFLDEYRAWYMERTSIGENPPNVGHMKSVLRNLATNAPGGSAYDPLREVYKNDPEFKKVVDQMAADLNGTPPKTTSPEDLRLKLKALPGRDKSDYLDKTGNLDNH